MQIQLNFDLTPFNSYRIAATCARVFFPENEEDIKTIFSNYVNEYEKILIGGGYNIIFSKTYYPNDFIIMGESFSKMQLEAPNGIVCESGASTLQLSEFALLHSLSGAEVFYDIPSSIGGAVVMNAGASGEETKDILEKVRYLDLEDLDFKEIQKEDIGFAYRNSIFQQTGRKIVLKAWYKLDKGNAVAIKEKMEQIKALRWSKQPKEFPNAGSVFKRPPGYYVGPMMTELGLKGFRIGDAMISEKHGGFIVNVGRATGADILGVISKAQQMVKEKFGVDLEIEQRII